MYIELEERFGSAESHACCVPVITVNKNPFLLFKTAVYMIEKYFIENQRILF